MRFLLLSHTSEFSSGGEKSLVELAQNLIEKGHEVLIITPDKGSLSTHLQSLGINAVVIPFRYWVSSNYVQAPHNDTSAADMTAVSAISNLIVSYQPDFCVTNTSVIPWLAYAASIHNVRHIWCVREYADLDYNFTFELGMQSSYATIRALSDKVFANSIGVRDVIAQRMGVPSGDIGLLYPYVSPPKKTIKTTNPFSTKGLKVVIIGNIRPSKGQFDAVKGFHWALKNGLAESELILIGTETDPVYTQKIKNFIQKQNIGDYVSFAGFQKDPYIFTVNADVCLVCSTMEAFGRVTVEAMLAGAVVVGKNTAGTSEIIQKGTGYLYENIDEMGSLLVKLGSQPSTLKKIRDTALSYASKTFSKEYCYKEFYKYIDSQPAKTAVSLHLLSGYTDALREAQDAAKISAEQLQLIYNSKRYHLAQNLAKPVEYIHRNRSK